jgi:hypothetical protein
LEKETKELIAVKKQIMDLTEKMAEKVRNIQEF